MAAQPTGTVTLLFTDIEGSTALLQRLGSDRYAEALDLHRRLLREPFVRHGGFEVDCEGDAFFVAFGRAKDAAAAALDAQQALAGAGWPEGSQIRVRIGIHTGEPLVIPPRYVGLDVHKAARVMSAAHGGQIVASRETRELLGDTFVVTDCGEHRLKDLSGPQRLFQVGRGEFPPLKTLYRSTLPVVSTPFVGRRREVLAVRSLVGEGARVVTITGPGGGGKTRLALQVAADLVDRFVDGVFFVPLQAIVDPLLVLPTVASVVGAPADVAGHIGARRMLLVIDNFEQLLAAAADMSALSASCPNLQLLITSRSALRIGGEEEFPLDPLGIDEAVALFIDCARRVGRSITVDESVIGVCERLDRLPLAIELAAARARIFSSAELLRRLDRRLPLLTGGRRDVPERQRALRPTIEWSYDLLAADEQVLFAELAAFDGGATVDAIEQVCSGSAIVDGLTSLVEKSLLRRRTEATGGTRLWMLETIREYALERLAALSEAEAMRERHAFYFLDWVDAIAPESNVGYDNERGAAVSADEANIREALSWFRGTGRRGEFNRLAVAIWPVWYHRSLLAESQRILREALQNDPGPDLAAVALDGLSACAFRAGDLQTATSAAAEAIDRARPLLDKQPLLHALRDYAIPIAEQGRFEEAEEALAESYAIAVSVNNHPAALAALLNQGHLALMRGDYHSTIQLNGDAAALAEAAGIDDPYERAVREYNTGYAQLKLGDLDRAEENMLRSLAAVGTDFAEGISYPLSTLAAIAGERDQCTRAANLLGATDQLLADTGLTYESVEEQERQRLRESLQEALGSDAFQAAHETGRRRPIKDVVAEELQR